jgi:hypothetical protein
MSEITLSQEWLANIRHRAENNMGLCLREHTVHNKEDDPEGTVVWITCDDDPDEPTVLGSINFPRTSQDRSDEIRYFISSTLAHHNTVKSGDVVLTLLAALGA